MRTLSWRPRPAGVFLGILMKKKNADLPDDRADILLLHAVLGAAVLCTNPTRLPSQAVPNKAEITRELVSWYSSHPPAPPPALQLSWLLYTKLMATGALELPYISV